MRHLPFLFLTILSGCIGHAQTPAPAHTYAMPEGKKATLKLSYAHQINVKTWDKPSLDIQTTLETNREDLKGLYRLEAQDGKSELVLSTEWMKEADFWKKNHCWNTNCDSIASNQQWIKKDKANGDCVCLQLDYDIMLPVGTELSIETISGDIEIRGHNGNLFAKTISGFVDIDRSASNALNLDFHSVTGIIYSNFDIQVHESSSAYDRKVKTMVNGGGTAVKAETISGDIFFRKR